MKILVVDDNGDAADSLSDLLELDGHLVEVRYSGEEALAAFQPGKFGMVFMDLKMPGMGGLQAAREMIVGDPGVRVVIVTGNTVKEDHDEILNAGVYKLLRKPYDPTLIGSILPKLPP